MCIRDSNKVERVRINLSKQQYWPVTFKVILDNNLVAKCNSHKPTHEDGSYSIDYIYPSHGNIPKSPADKDLVASHLYKKGKALDNSLYKDAWQLEVYNSIPFILRQFAFRSLSRILIKQLQRQGVETSDAFNVQFHDEDNYLLFSYEGLKQTLTQQLQLYAHNSNIKNLAADLYFKHSENKQWFLKLTR